MGIYGNVANAYFDDQYNTLMECYTDTITYLTEDDSEMIFEYALLQETNMDAIKDWVKSKKEMKEGLKDYKAALKAKDYKKAKSELDKVTKQLETRKKQIKDMKQDVGSAVLGSLASIPLTALEMIVPFTITGLGLAVGKSGLKGAMNLSAAAGDSAMNMSGVGQEFVKQGAKALGGSAAIIVGEVWTAIKGIIILIKNLKIMINEIKADGVSAKNFNGLRTNLIRYMDDAIKKVNDLKTSLPK